MAEAPAQIAANRGVEEVLHFTTEKGVLGALQIGNLLSRKRVQGNPDLAFIFTGVWPRRDPAWLDHVSLSLTKINRSLYLKAAANLPELWWAIFSFRVEILDHPGVVFTTTNNVYEEVCERGEGAVGLRAMFQDHVPWGYYGSVKHRQASRPKSEPTDIQAEVLYPEEISLDYLQRLYVPEDQHRSLVLAWCEVLETPEPPISVVPDLFT
jgi:hypothetical protein